MEGAMENWGLIIGAMSVLLVEPVRVDQRAREQVASIQSHFVAHMWYAKFSMRIRQKRLK